jgi:hypothetical protein
LEGKGQQDLSITTSNVVFLQETLKARLQEGMLGKRYEDNKSCSGTILWFNDYGWKSGIQIE